MHDINFTISPKEKNPKRGRPNENVPKVFIGFQVESIITLNPKEVEKKLNTKGRFILATNELNINSLPDYQILKEYKDQQGVERGFRFLKDPWFMVDSIFLKSPRRIEALMMIMTLCLMVNNVAQFKVRKKLVDENK